MGKNMSRVPLFVCLFVKHPTDRLNHPPIQAFLAELYLCLMKKFYLTPSGTACHQWMTPEGTW